MLRIRTESILKICTLLFIIIIVIRVIGLHLYSVTASLCSKGLVEFGFRCTSKLGVTARTFYSLRATALITNGFLR